MLLKELMNEVPAGWDVVSFHVNGEASISKGTFTLNRADGMWTYKLNETRFTDKTPRELINSLKFHYTTLIQELTNDWSD